MYTYTSANEQNYVQVVSEKVTATLPKLARLPMSMISSVYPCCNQAIIYAAHFLDLTSSIDACIRDNERRE